MSTKSSRTLLVTLLGAFVRRTDDWLPISSIVTLFDALEVEESSVRTGVSRLKKRRWLVAERRQGRQGYRLTELAKQSFKTGDKVIWHARQPADLADGWCVASFSVPEKERANRHLLRSRLATLGFGNVGGGVWIAPARMRDEAAQVIGNLGLSEYTNLFVGEHAGGQQLVEMVSSSWDLDDIHNRYKSFVSDHTPDIEALDHAASRPISEREAFVRYMRTLDDWRMLPMQDPGLPRELLPKNWAGDEAAQLLERVVAELDQPALAFVKSTADEVLGGRETRVRDRVARVRDRVVSVA